MNDENLKPFSTLTESQQREIRSKGGKASVEKKRRIKTFQEIGEALSKATLKEGEIFELEKIRDIGQLKGANLSIKEIMFWKQVQKALDGDTKAFEVVRDTMWHCQASKRDLLRCLRYGAISEKNDIWREVQRFCAEQGRCRVP